MKVLSFLLWSPLLPEKKAPSTHWIEDEAGFKAILHTLVARKTLTTLFSPYLIT
jgi:hypothetical protein